MSGGRVIIVNGSGAGGEVFVPGNPGYVAFPSTGPAVNDGATTAPSPQMLYNGATYDIQRNNIQGTLLASAARTATTMSANQTNYNARGLHVTLDISVASGTGGLQIRAQGIDIASGNFYSLNGAPTAIVATGTYDYEFYPGVSGVVAGSNNVNGRSSTSLPRIWRLTVTHGDASSYTYSVGFSYVI